MNFLNRRGIFLTRRSDELSKVTSSLMEDSIEYTTRTNSITNPGRYHGIPGIRSEYAYEYRVYVHKKDFERAKHVIGK